MNKISTMDGVKAGFGWTIGAAIGSTLLAVVITPAAAWIGGKLCQAYSKLKSNETPQTEEVKE